MGKDYSSVMENPLGQRLRELPGPLLLTGHTGFKGTWMTFLLEHLNVPVVGRQSFHTKSIPKKLGDDDPPRVKSNLSWTRTRAHAWVLL